MFCEATHSMYLPEEQKTNEYEYQNNKERSMPSAHIIMHKGTSQKHAIKKNLYRTELTMKKERMGWSGGIMPMVMTVL
jgi:hypothetical protein